jgi:C1A family cysteine protease
MKLRVGVAFLILVILSVVVKSEESEPIYMKRNILKEFEDGDTKNLFKVYHYLFKKEYDLNNEEGVRRYKIFKNNLEYIKQENKKGHSYTLGFTHLTDMTEEEYKKMYLNTEKGFIDAKFKELENQAQSFFDKYADVEDTNPNSNTNSDVQKSFFDLNADKDDEEFLATPPKKISKNFFDLNADDEDKDELKLKSRMNETVRAPIDHRRYFLPPRNQGSCGSCWAFSAAGSMESNYAKAKGVAPFYLSTQQLTDCDTNSNGCGGGSSVMALQYYSLNPGLVADGSYPYKGVKATCQAGIVSNTAIVKYKNIGTDYCGDCTIDQWYLSLSKGPITISSYADVNWQHYTSGILSITSCASSSSNHAVIAVGWGVDSSTGSEYTIVRNSWSTSWGEAGYIRIKYQPQLNKSCFINMRASQPKF